MHASNNFCESPFGGLLESITKSSMIGLQHTGAISIALRNDDFNVNRIFASNKNVNNGEHVNFLCVLRLIF